MVHVLATYKMVDPDAEESEPVVYWDVGARKLLPVVCKRWPMHMWYDAEILRWHKHFESEDLSQMFDLSFLRQDYDDHTWAWNMLLLCLMFFRG